MSILDMIKFLCKQYSSAYNITKDDSGFTAMQLRKYEFPEEVNGDEAKIRYMYRDPIHHTPRVILV